MQIVKNNTIFQTKSSFFSVFLIALLINEYLFFFVGKFLILNPQKL